MSVSKEKSSEEEAGEEVMRCDRRKTPERKKFPRMKAGK